MTGTGDVVCSARFCFQPVAGSAQVGLVLVRRR
jgi:hypothetical protein